MNLFIILLSLALWGVVHSFLASHLAKDLFGMRRLYRLLYNVFSAMTFAPILYLLMILEDTPLYQASSPWSWVMRGGQLLSALLLLIAVLQTDTLSFVGLR